MAVHRTLKTSTAIAVALAATLSQSAQAATCAWSGGSGSYTDPTMWSCNAVPGAGDTVLIDNGRTGVSSPVTLANTTGYAGTLAVDGGDRLALTNSFLRIAGGSAVVNGIVSIAGASRLTTNGGAAVSLGGTGTILLDASSNYAQLGGEGAVYTIGTGLTVAGTGQVGFDDTRLVNNGLISANVAGGVLTLDSAGGSGGVAGGFGVSGNAGFFNTGTMQAANGGTLRLESGRYENGAGGVMRALAGSTVDLDNDVRIVGGTLASVGTGRIAASDDNQYLNGVTIAAGSTLALTNDFVNINGTLTNNGTITIAAASRLRSEGGTNASILGTGIVTLDNSANYAVLAGQGGIFTIGSGITVNGAGGVGDDSSVVVNNGLISATAGTIGLDPAYGSGGGGTGAGADGISGFVNNGVMQAAGTGNTLSFNSGRYDNTNGIIQAIAGGTVDFQNDVYLRGGLLTGSGTIKGTDDNQYFSGVTLAAGSTLALTNDFLNIDGSITDNGTITLAAASRLRGINGASASLVGSGTVVLDNSANYAVLAGQGGNFTIGSGITVRGAGGVGDDSSVVVNNGLISATAGTIGLDPAYGSGGGGTGAGADGISGFVNNGVMQAAGTGNTLSFNSGRYDNTSGTIQAINGGTVDFQNDVYLRGGLLTGSGTIKGTDDNQYFSGVTLAAGSTLALTNDFLNIDGTLTNNGTITLAAASRLRGINGASASLVGSGTVVLDNSANYAVLAGQGGIFTIGSGITVRGAGSVGDDSSLVVNNGLISATTGQTYLDPAFGAGGPGAGNGVGTGLAYGFANNATLQANGAGAVLNFLSGRYDNTNGTIQAINGGTVDFQNDVYVTGGTIGGSGTIRGTDDNQYFNGVTLAAGSTLALTNDFLNIDGSITDNGTITLAAASRLRGINGANASILGTGTVTFDNSSNYAVLAGQGGAFTIGSGITVNGAGSVGDDSSFVVNNGLISATGGTITLDPVYGAGGPGSGGVGTNGASGFFNTGTIQATATGAIAMNGGRYENSATGALVARGGGALTMNGDAFLTNLGSGNVLDLGAYRAIGAGSTVTLRGGADAIGTIGAAGSGTDTVVTLSGAGSGIGVYAPSTGITTAIDSSLYSVAQTGRLEILAGRTFTVAANGGAFSNAGVVQLGGGTFSDSTYTNSGLTFGFGTTGAIGNTGTVQATGDTLATGAIIGASGVVRVDAGATLNLAAATTNSTAGTLVDDGTLALGSRNVTVTSDFRDANFGMGNAFNGRAGVTGSGLILASSATQDLSGPGYNSSAATLNVGNVRVGQSTSTTLTVTNNGTQTLLRGAVQNTNAPGVTLSNADFAIGPNGGSSTTTIGFSGATAGSLAGQSLGVVNNFDNVADRTVALQGNVYQVAVAGAQPASITLAPVRAGTMSSSATVTVQNVAPATNGFTESLRSTVTGSSGFLTNGDGPVTTGALGAGGSQGVTIGHDTATAGQFTGTVTIANTSLAQASSGLADLSLGSQTITVNSTITQTAAALLGNIGMGTLTGSGTSYTLDLGKLAAGGSSTANLSVLNTILSSSYSEALGGSFALTAATGYSFAGTPFSGLAGGQTTSGNLLTFAAGSLANGSYSTLLTFGGTSSYSGLADLALPRITINVLASVDNATPPPPTPTRTDAVAQLGATSVNLGVVRQGSADPTATVSVTNAASASGADSLVTSTGATPTGVAVTAPGTLAPGQSGTAVFDLSTATAGIYSGNATLNFASRNATMADDVLPSQTVAVTGTVTQLSIASILKSAGVGTLTGSGASYVLDLGTVTSGSSTSTTLGVLNAIPASGYAERLGGSFSLTGSSAYSFSGAAFSGLTGGQTAGGDLLGFSSASLASGQYDALLTFSGTSSYSGLTDATLSPIRISIRALVSGASTPPPPTSAVPEPGIWMQMLVGVGLLGGFLRRRRRAPAAMVAA